MHKLAWGLTFWGLLCSPALALDPARTLTQYLHDAWTVKDGLPQNTVHDVLQDRQGYMWIAARDGLLRFDGQRFTPVDLGPAAAVGQWPGPRALHEGREGIWIGTHAPPFVLLVKDGRLAGRWRVRARTDTVVRSLYEDASGTLWIGTDGGLFALRDGVVKPQKTALGLPTWYAGGVLRDRRGRLWTGSGAAVVAVEDGRNTLYDADDGLAPGHVQCLLEDRDGAIWVGSQGGLSRISDGAIVKYGLEAGLPHSSVYDLAEDHDGNLWVGTHRGLVRFRDGRFVARPAPAGLAKIHVLALSVDAEGTVWAATEERGLHRFRDGVVAPFGSLEGLPTDWIMAVHGGDDGALWLGTDMGLLRWEPGAAGGAPRVTHYPIEDCEREHRVKSVFVDSRQTVWIGTYGRLFRLAPGATQPVAVDLGAPPLGCSERIQTMLEATDGAIWAATSRSGIRVLRAGRVTAHFTSENGLPGNDVTLLKRTRDGAIWAATGEGLARFAEGTWTTHPDPGGLSGAVSALLEGHDGALWVGTQHNGLKRYSSGRWTAYTRAHGLPGSSVYALEEDDDGQLWVLGELGLMRARSSDLNGRARTTSAEPPRIFGEADGIRGLPAYDLRHPAVWKTSDGRLWFATPKGVAMVDPRRLRTNTIAPRVLVERMLRNGRAVDDRTPMSFPPGNAAYEFQYTALGLSTPERARFRYRLTGLEDRWTEAGQRRAAYFNHVPPGAYTFEVQAANEDGFWSEPTTLAFRQRPFLYQRPEFYFVILLGVTALSSAAHLFRVRRLSAQQARLERLVSDRTRELSEASRRLDAANHDLERTNHELEEANHTLERRVEEGIGRLREAERMAAYGQMVAAVAHEVRHPIFALQAAAYVVRERLKQGSELHSQLRVLETESQRLETLMSDLLDFARPVVLQIADTRVDDIFDRAIEAFRTEGHTTTVRQEAAPGLPEIRVDAFRTVQAVLNLMRNAALHASGLTAIVLAARTVEADAGRRVRLSVADDGAGIQRVDTARIFDPFVTSGRGTGLGLAIVRRTVTAQGGDVHVESAPGRGTVFHLDLPAADPSPGHVFASA